MLTFATIIKRKAVSVEMKSLNGSVSGFFIDSYNMAAGKKIDYIHYAVCRVVCIHTFLRDFMNARFYSDLGCAK